MTPRPILSILTPAVPSRLGQLEKLCEEIEYQICDRAVEHLVLLDNKKRTVGEKRDALLRAARGDYVAFVDDDDDIAKPAHAQECKDHQGRLVSTAYWDGPGYVESLLKAANDKPDVITFRQSASYNGLGSEIEFKLGNPNEQFTPNGITRRNAWHVCAWRRTLAIQSSFPASNYGEDWAFAAPLCALPNLREVHIPHVLHFYRHDARTTEAPEPK